MGRRILIVGGSSVLGCGVARALFQTELLWLTYRTMGKETALRDEFASARLSWLDVVELESVKALASAVKKEWSALDGLVYAAGTGLLWPASRTDDRKLSEVWSVNVSGVQRILREFYPLLIKGDAPSIVLLSSIMGLSGAGGMSAYAAAKAALIGLARSLAVEWAPHGIRVNSVAPGIVPSPLVDDMFKYLAAEQVIKIRDKHPLGFGRPDDVGNAVRFLLSPESRWITGVVLPVDGGYSAQ